jgi:hypothetical protein
MKTKLYVLVLSLFISSAIMAQGIRVLNASEYDQLKRANQLPSKFMMKKTEGEQTILIPRIDPPDNLVHSNSICDCLLPLDSTYNIVPFNAGTPPEYRNDDGSSPAIVLPFSFCFFGQTINSIYINNNGDVSFGSPCFTFISDSFPSANFSMLAALWADVDTRDPLSGLVYYKVTPTSIIIKWEHVGYFPMQGDKLNTYQLILTDGTDPLIANGNVAFCYGDMQWTSGGIGFGAPATAGANLGNGINYTQFGRFNGPGYGYDGPFGANDSVDWLDSSNFIFDMCAANTSPIPFDCNNDTIFLRVGDTTALDVSFLDPNPVQIISIGVNPGGLLNFNTTNNSSGSLARFEGTLIPDAMNLGFNTLTLTATDNGVPALTTIYNRIIHIELPTGIGQNNFSPFISFSPNPFTDQTILTVSGMNGRNVTLSITDVTGREVKKAEHITSTYTIEKGNLTKGIYFYQVTDGNSVNEKGKLIIQ